MPYQEVGGGGLSTETFTSDEARALRPYFSNADRPVFVLITLPETVMGALSARYSRSAKSLRRLFLDEFLGDIQGETHGRGVRLQPDSGPPEGGPHERVGTTRADKLYAKVLNE